MEEADLHVRPHAITVVLEPLQHFAKNDFIRELLFELGQLLGVDQPVDGGDEFQDSRLRRRWERWRSLVRFRAEAQLFAPAKSLASALRRVA
jgi:hypothetical protein